ncbi:MAG: AraC family transcriptional regulator [Deltaproteobacteria bacterium]|nr:AraC family transcriptional regulator [Deltaproteobacteria bacterium]
MAKSKESLSIQSRFVPMVLSYLHQRGVDVRGLIERAGLPAAAATVRRVELPLQVIRRFADLAAVTARDPFLGLHVAQAASRSVYSILEFIALAGPTLRDMGERWVRFARLENAAAVVSFVQTEAGGVIGVDVPGEPLCMGRQMNELLMGHIVRVTRDALQEPHWLPQRLWFAHPAPADDSELRAYFRTPLEFGRGSNGLAVSNADLDRPLPRRDDQLLAYLEEQATAMLSERPTDDFWPALRRHIRDVLPDGTPRLSDVAHRMAMSARTLQRRLSKSGKSFVDAADDVRRDLACAYLAQHHLSLAEVSFLVGYSEPSAFARAFKRWLGVTPAEYRGQAPHS